MEQLLPDVSYADMGAALRCPVCAVTVLQGNSRVCPGCGSPHHDDCWSWAGGCGVAGCSSRGLAAPDDPGRYEGVVRVVREWSRCLREQRAGLLVLLACLMLLVPAILLLGPLGLVVWFLLVLAAAHYVANAVRFGLLRRQLEALVPGHLVTVGRPPEQLRPTKASRRDEARAVWGLMMAFRVFGVVLAGVGVLLLVGSPQGSDPAARMALAFPPLSLGLMFALLAPRLFGDRLGWAEGIRNRCYAGLERGALGGPPAK